MSGDGVSANAWMARWMLLLLSAGGMSWGWHVWPAYLAWSQANELAQRMEQQDMQERALEAKMQGTPAQRVGTQPEVTPDMPVSEVVLLTQWQALLRQHHLAGWQGRLGAVTPDLLVQGGQASGGRGPVWRLEGPATYGQGVALLQSLAQTMHGVVLTQVQARLRPDSPWLDWSLQWQSSAGLPTLRWGARWPPAQAVTVDPFAADRLRTTHTALPADMSSSERGDLVLPQVALRDLRLAGVLLSQQESLALIVSLAPRRDTSPVAGHTAAAQPAWRSLRVGQRLGQERATVLAIEPRRVMLQASGRPDGSQGRQVDTPVVLELVALSSALSTGGEP